MADAQKSTIAARTVGRPFVANDPRRCKTGRPAIAKDVKELAGKYTKQAILTLAHLMEFADDERTKVAAAKELLDRACGKAAQAVTLGGEDGQPLKLYVEFSPSDWEASAS